MPLLIAPTGQELKVIKVSANGKIRHYLESLGIYPGAIVYSLLRNKDSLIIKIKDSRLAINKSIAMSIFVN